MSFEQAIHRHWSAWQPLTALVPETRVFTGLARGGPPRPYVTLERVEPSQTTRTSSGALLEALRVRLTIWDDDLDRAKQVAGEVLRHFHRAAFPFDGGRVLDCKPVEQVERQEAGGVWRVALDYVVQTETRGD
jgi:hypothetical protein